VLARALTEDGGMARRTRTEPVLVSAVTVEARRPVSSTEPVLVRAWTSPVRSRTCSEPVELVTFTAVATGTVTT
jgi:hypothetical protein